jgi:hypothetical protein
MHTNYNTNIRSFCNCGSIAIVAVICYAVYGFANPFANFNSDHYLQCRGEIFEEARAGEVRGAEQVMSTFAQCK